MATATSADISNFITEALARNRKARDVLAENLDTILMALPTGTTLRTPTNVIEITTIYCGCSEYDHNPWFRVGEVKAVLVDGQLIAGRNPAVWDSRDLELHTQTTRFYRSVDFDHLGPAIEEATTTTLRSVATALPALLAAWVNAIEADTRTTLGTVVRVSKPS